MNHWFRAKDFGWGWTPASWQGWLVLLTWFLANAWVFSRIDLSADTIDRAFYEFLAFALISTFLLILVCWKKGERPTWRWGGHTVQSSVVWRKMFWLLIFILVAQVAGLIGSYFTFDAIPTWYASLAKPSFAPPNWLFGPVWTTLYALMGIAGFFAWDLRHEKTSANRALNWYWFQLLLNALWSPIFFGLQNIGLALFVIIALWLSIIMMLREFRKVNVWLFIVLLPYLAWVSFASVLNFSLWRLNV